MIIYGHRGARFEAPENTIPGFAYARSLGLTAVEFDVRMTSDGRLVVIHDGTVDRTTDGTGRVADLTFDQIRALDARAIFPDFREACQVPTFDEVLDEVGDLDQLEIEIKKDPLGRSEAIATALLETLDRHQVDAAVTVTSFHPESLRLVQRLAPEQARGYIGEWDSDAWLDIAQWLGASRAGISHVTGTPAVVAAAREAGLMVHGWPCNTEDALRELEAWGVDAVCTDAPTTIMELAERAA